MSAPQRVRAWIAQNYQRPAIDQASEWLADCSTWIASELGFDPNKDFDQFIQHVEAQLLQSNLADSTVPGSGIDPLLVASNPNSARPRPSRVPRLGRQAPRQKKTTGPIPLLVEIKSITEIAHSAFSLLNTHQTRIDRADLGLAQEENTEQQHHDEDEGPVPKFPRGMLRLELSDGSATFGAIEFRPLPQLELGTTPLGYKMCLKSTPIRNGVAFLEPENVILKGYRTEDHDISREQIFLSSLRKRLGRLDPPPEPPDVAQPQPNLPVQPAPAQSVPRLQHPPDNFDDANDIDPDVLREMAIQIDELDGHNDQRSGVHGPLPGPSSASKVTHDTSSNPRQTLQAKSNTTIAPSSHKAPSSTASTVRTSLYFPSQSRESVSTPDIGLSPRPIFPPNPSLDFDDISDIDELGCSKPPVTKAGSTSARPPAKPVTLPEKRPSSPDSFDDLSFDMDVDFERLDMIEQSALGTSTNDKGKGKARDTRTEDMTSYHPLSLVSAKKASSSSVLGTSSLVKCPFPLSGTETSTGTQRSTKTTPGASSLSSSAEPPLPFSTQSPAQSRRLARDPSLIVISSSEDEGPGVHGKGKPLDLARRRAKKPRQMGQIEVADRDVIDISD